MIYVAVGFGFFVEMTLDEATAFIERKTVALRKKAKALDTNISLVKANMRMVLEGLRELQKLNPSLVGRRSESANAASRSF
jgi:prefoldin subunit 5